MSTDRDRATPVPIGTSPQESINTHDGKPEPANPKDTETVDDGPTEVTQANSASEEVNQADDVEGGHDDAGPLDTPDEFQLALEAKKENESRVRETIKGLLKADLGEGATYSLQDVATTENTGYNFPEFHVYLRINGKSFSTPSKQQAEAIQRPLGNSIDHQLMGVATGNDYAFIKICQFASGMKVCNSCVGEIRVMVKDMKDFGVKFIADRNDVLAKVAEFNAEAREVRNSAVAVMTFKASRVDPDFEVLALESLLESNVGAEIASPQMEGIREILKGASDTSPLDVELLLIPDGFGYAGRVRTFETLVGAVHKLEHDDQVDYYEPFFAANEQTKRQRTIPLSQVPDINDDDFPGVLMQPRNTRYSSSDQQVVYQLVGSACEARAEEYQINRLKEESFNVALLPCNYVDRESRCIMIVLAEDRAHLLPQNGEQCRVKLPTKPRVPAPEPTVNTEPEPISDDTVKAISSRLVELGVESAGMVDQDGDFRVKVSMYFTTALMDDDVDALQRVDNEKKNVYTRRVHDFCVEKRDILNAAAVAGPPAIVEAVPATTAEAAPPTTEEPAPPSHDSKYSDMPTTPPDTENWCPAHRLDISGLELKPDWSAFLVFQSRSMNNNHEDFDSVAQIENETWTTYLDRVTSASNLRDVTIQRLFSDKAIKAEFLALNSLKWPKGAPYALDQKSIKAYRYLQRFEYEELRSIFVEIPNLDKVRKNESPRWIMDKFNDLDHTKQQAFRNLESMPDGVKIVPGVAASGKSTWFNFLIFATYFGGSPVDSMPGKVDRDEKKILVCVNNNAAVNTFARNLTSAFIKAGLKEENAPPVVRMYAMASEVGRMGSNKGPKRQPDSFNRKAAEDATDEIKFNASALFLAEYKLAKVEIAMHEERANLRRQRGVCRDMSLQQHAARYLLDNPSNHPELSDLLRRDDTDGYTKEEIPQLKSLTKFLYRDFLENFSGVVCCTPVAATEFQFRRHFRPNVVLVDEGGRIKETELLMLVAWFPGPWIVVGDHHQLPPFVHVDPGVKGEIQSSNPFVRQLSYSTLARAVHAGVTDSYLVINHRSLANLVGVPSKLFYRGHMDIPMKRDRYPASVVSFNLFLKSIVPGLADESCRIIAHFPGSWVSKLGTSSYNLAHVRWAVEQVVAVIKNPALESVKGGPASILLLPYYQAQRQQYETEILKRIEIGDISRDEYRRIEISTLDSAQGVEADFCIVDLTRTDDPGFTGNLSRQCLSTTRARQCEILLAGPGMFTGLDDGRKWQSPAAKILSRLYTLVEKDGAIATIKTCVICETPGTDHDASECPHSKSHIAFIKCESCRSDSDHNQKTCPSVKCRQCGVIGHRTSECVQPLPCSRCLQTGHRVIECRNVLYCAFCGGLHYSHECEVACHMCRSREHGTESCPLKNRPVEKRPRDRKPQVCRICGKPGHLKLECPEKPLPICRNCNEVGHVKRDCQGEPVCKVCGKSGHMRKDCPEAQNRYRRTEKTGPSAYRTKLPATQLIEDIIAGYADTSPADDDDVPAAASAPSDITPFTETGHGPSDDSPDAAAEPSGISPSTETGDGPSDNSPAAAAEPSGSSPSTATGFWANATQSDGWEYVSAYISENADAKKMDTAW